MVSAHAPPVLVVVVFVVVVVGVARGAEDSASSYPLLGGRVIVFVYLLLFSGTRGKEKVSAILHNFGAAHDCHFK